MFDDVQKCYDSLENAMKRHFNTKPVNNLT